MAPVGCGHPNADRLCWPSSARTALTSNTACGGLSHQALMTNIEL